MAQDTLDGAAKTKKGRSNKLRGLTREVIWARGAGRCYMCNRELIGDLLSGKFDAKFGLIAHIVADAPNGPRGDEARSALLADDPANLMLMCHEHHKLIDEHEDEYPEPLLLDMKKKHEDRIAAVTALAEDRATQVVRYAANVGVHRSLLPYPDVTRALILSERYPASPQPIDLGLLGSVLEDDEERFWTNEEENLKRLFDRRVRERIDAGDAPHLSVFAIAPQPLLIRLGTLLGDIWPSEVYQLHREPAGWAWPVDGPAMPLQTDVANPGGRTVALKIALSATADDARIRSVLGEDVAIWSITTPVPHNDVLKRKGDLAEFRRQLRTTLDRIKATHPDAPEINIFPVMPVATAVETGRVRMPKADLPFVVLDENRKLGGFRRALRIEN